MLSNWSVNAQLQAPSAETIDQTRNQQQQRTRLPPTLNTNLTSANNKILHHQVHGRKPSYDASSHMYRQSDNNHRSRSNSLTTTTSSNARSDFTRWGIAEVGSWLEGVGMGKYRKVFADNHIKGDILPELTYDTLKQLGITLIADRHRIIQAAKKLNGNFSPSSSVFTAPTSPLSPSSLSIRPSATPTFEGIPQRHNLSGSQSVSSTSPPMSNRSDSMQPTPSSASASQQWWDEPTSPPYNNSSKSPVRVFSDTAVAVATLPKTSYPQSSQVQYQPVTHGVNESLPLSNQWAAWLEGNPTLPRKTTTVPSEYNVVASPQHANQTYREQNSRPGEKVSTNAGQHQAKILAALSPPKIPRMTKSIEALLGAGSAHPSSPSLLSTNKMDQQQPATKEATGLQKFLRFRKPSKSGMNEIIAPGGLVTAYEEVSPTYSEIEVTPSRSLRHEVQAIASPDTIILDNPQSGLNELFSAERSRRNKPPHPLIISQRNAFHPAQQQQPPKRSPPPPLPSRPQPPIVAASISSMTEFGMGPLSPTAANCTPLRPSGKITSPSHPSASFLEKMVNKINAKAAPSHEGGSDAEFEARKAICIKVDCKTSTEPAKIVQVSDIADNAFKIRERVMDRFGIHPDDRAYYHFYAGSVAHALKDAELVGICKTPTSSLRGIIQLRREQFFPDPEVHRAQQRQLAAVRESTMPTANLAKSTSGKFITKFTGQSAIPAFPSVPRFNQVQGFHFEAGAPFPAQAEKVFERPPSELIVDKFDDWFPELAQKESPEAVSVDEPVPSNISGSHHRINNSITQNVVATEPRSSRKLSLSSELPSRVSSTSRKTTTVEGGHGLDGLPRRRTVKDLLAETVAQRRLSKRVSNAAPLALCRRSTKRNNVMSMGDHELSEAQYSHIIDDADTFKERVRSMGQDTWLFQQWESMPSIASSISVAARLAELDNVKALNTRSMSVQSNSNISGKRNQPNTVIRSFNGTRPPTAPSNTLPPRILSKLSEPPVTALPAEPSSAPAGSLSHAESMDKLPEIEPSSATSSDAATSPVSALPGKRWQWTKGRLIGKGSFGAVYMGLVIENETTELVAVKQVALNPQSKGSRAPPVAGKIGGMVGVAADSSHSKNIREDALSKSRRRMEDALNREIELLKDLHHENIVRYLGFEMTDSTLNLFLEYVSGGSVSSLVSRVGELGEDLTRWIIVQVLCGLEYLHERYIIHRDIKGANILVTDEGVAKISDFGISKKHEDRMAYRPQERMSVQGSIYWMAPEMINGQSGYSAKVDIWSVGCVMLEMMTGRHPWAIYDPTQAVWRIGKGLSVPPLPEDLSEAAYEFLSNCFVIDAEERPTATDLLDHKFLVQDPEFCFRKAVERAVIMLKLSELDDDEDLPISEDRTMSCTGLHTTGQALDEQEKSGTSNEAAR